MEKTIIKECPECGHVIGVSYDEVDEADAIKCIEARCDKHAIKCRREKCKE